MDNNLKNIPQVGPMDPAKRNSPVVDRLEDNDYNQSRSTSICYFNGKEYSYGAQVCSAGKRLFCGNGNRWWAQGNC